MSSVKCGCKGRSSLESGRNPASPPSSGPHEHQINHNYQSARLKAQSSPFPTRHSAQPYQGTLPYSSPALPFSNENLPYIQSSLPVYIHSNPTLYSSQNSLPTRHIPGSVIVNPLPPSAVHDPVAPQVEEGLDHQQEEGEPIYAEIKPKSEEQRKEEVHVKEDEGKVKSKGKKKEVEYWQITAKEVVKFRPCTETFIYRS